MSGFKLRISGVGSDRSTNWATNTALFLPWVLLLRPLEVLSDLSYGPFSSQRLSFEPSFCSNFLSESSSSDESDPNIININFEGEDKGEDKGEGVGEGDGDGDGEDEGEGERVAGGSEANGNGDVIVFDNQDEKSGRSCSC